jgi:hypothetical protein
LLFHCLLFFTTKDTKEDEQKVLEDLSQLKAQMRWLVGNGHPGKLKELEDRVERHEQFVNRVGGISAFVATVITLLHVGIDYLRVHR